MKKIVYTDDPCVRCDSKQFISRTWIQQVPTYSGKMTEVECSQIECTNKECQAEFTRNLLEERERKEVIRLKREQNDAERIKNSLLHPRKGRPNKSRI